MNQMLGSCGLDCRTCPIHLATLEAEVEKKLSMRAEIALICRERYGLHMEANEVGDCDGCRSGRLFVTCSSCRIRQCAMEKRIDSCALCEQYACENLLGIFREDPAARDRLVAIRDLR